MVLRLSSSRPINEPFVDLVLDATWSRAIVRSYTMLFDPPAQAAKPAEVTVAPQLAAPRYSESAPTPPYILGAARRAPAAAPAAAARGPHGWPGPSRAPAATEAGAGATTP